MWGRGTECGAKGEGGREWSREREREGYKGRGRALRMMDDGLFLGKASSTSI